VFLRKFLIWLKMIRKCLWWWPQQMLSSVIIGEYILLENILFFF
jgi:hypothetical protein